MRPLFKRRPEAKEVAKRALVLFTVYQRGSIEEEAARDGIEASEQTRTLMRDWLRDVGLWPAATGRERTVLRTAVSRLDPQLKIDASWRLEAAAILLWALGCAEQMLPYDSPFAVPRLSRLPVPGAKEDVQRFIGASQLIPQHLIDRQREVAQTWHWRSRTAQLQRNGAVRSPDGVSLEKVISSTAIWAQDAGNFPTAIGGDFPALGKPYRDLNDDEYSLCTSIALERHHALNWLCGYSRDWDNVPTET